MYANNPEVAAALSLGPTDEQCHHIQASIVHIAGMANALCINLQAPTQAQMLGSLEEMTAVETQVRMGLDPKAAFTWQLARKLMAAHLRALVQKLEAVDAPKPTEG